MNDKEFAKIMYTEDPGKIPYKKALKALTKYYSEASGSELGKKDIIEMLEVEAKDANSTKERIAMISIVRIRAEAMAKIQESKEELGIT